MAELIDPRARTRTRPRFSWVEVRDWGSAPIASSRAFPRSACSPCGQSTHGRFPLRDRRLRHSCANCRPGFRWFSSAGDGGGPIGPGGTEGALWGGAEPAPLDHECAQAIRRARRVQPRLHRHRSDSDALRKLARTGQSDCSQQPPNAGYSRSSDCLPDSSSRRAARRCPRARGTSSRSAMVWERTA